jgi:hypothetical protein
MDQRQRQRRAGEEQENADHVHRAIPGIAMVFDIIGQLALKIASHLSLVRHGVGGRAKIAYSTGQGSAQTGAIVAQDHAVAL